MKSWVVRPISIMLVTLLLALPATSVGSLAWGNGSSSSTEWPNFGIHDITADIALRSASLTDGDLLTWMNDWYERNATDYGYSFDPASTKPTRTDNINAYTDDPDSYWKDWDNHTLYLNRRSWWDPPDGDASIRVSQLYNQTRDHLYGWLMNGSVRYDLDQHYAAYYAGLMAHYVMDITQFGHTDWTRLDHSHPLDDPVGATYHSYYEARSWSDRALRTMHVDLMQRPVPQLKRVSDPALLVYDLANFISGRHGPDVQYQDVDSNTVTLGSTYVKMLEMFVTDYDAQNSFKGARGYSEELWNLTRENLFAGMDNLTCLWTSAFLDARDLFRADAADVVVEQILFDPAEGAYEGLEVDITAHVHNVGNTSTGDMNVALFIDNGSVSEARIDLDVGQMLPVAFAWTAEGGEHEVRIVADVYRQVPEGNETNNVGWKMYSVAEAHHMSTLEVDNATLWLLQEDSGSFNVTLTNLGNKPDTYLISLDTIPGAVDFSLTLLAEEITLGSGERTSFSIDVATMLDNPVGPRYFRVIADGGNSTSDIVLTIIISQRNTAPHIVVDYDFYGNTSVPHVFDASGSWDREGDEVSFMWLREDDTPIKTGPILTLNYSKPGDHVIKLMAHDNHLTVYETLEVSILDAVPPALKLKLVDWDIDAAQISWKPWNNTRHFSEYRVYVSENNSDPEQIMAEGNVVATIEFLYEDNATVIMPFRYWWSEEVHIVLTVVNTFGDEFRSETVSFEPEIRHGYREGQWDWYDGDYIIHPLYWQWVYIDNVTKYSFEVEWREWVPIGEGGHYVLELRNRTENSAVEPFEETILDLTDTHRQFFGFAPGEGYYVSIRYISSDGRRAVEHSDYTRLVKNQLPVVRTAPRLDVVEDEEFTFHIVAEDPDGELTVVTINWGDGPFPLERPGGNVSLKKTYKASGPYTITVEVWDDDGNSTVVTTQVKVVKASEDMGGFWNSIIAIALIIFVALLGVIAGHLSGYYRIGREREGKKKADEPEAEPEEEAEPEQTAEEIISELEEDLGKEKDKEFFDHEPTVAELEEMIPKDHE